MLKPRFFISKNHLVIILRIRFNYIKGGLIMADKKSTFILSLILLIGYYISIFLYFDVDIQNVMAKVVPILLIFNTFLLIRQIIKKVLPKESWILLGLTYAPVIYLIAALVSFWVEVNILH